MSIGQKAAKGFFSLLSRNVLARIMGLISMVILARKLSPSDFGLVSITEVLLTMIAVFGVTGVFEFLVSYRGQNRAELNQSAFWFNIWMGLGVVLVLQLLAPFWAESNGDSRILTLSWLVSGIFWLSCLQILPKSILSERLDFDIQARIQTPFIILIPIGKIACAYGGLGVYSLLIPTLFFGLIQTLVFYRAVQWAFSWHFFPQHWAEIFRFSKHLIGTTFLSKVADEGDKLVVGKILGLEALGVYNLASQTAHLFPSNVSTITNQIFAAAFPKYAHDPLLMRERYLKTTQVIAFVSIPLMAVLALAADPLIRLVYSDKWQNAIIPFQILTIFAIYRTITSSAGAVFNALQVPQKAFYPLLVYAPVHLAVSYWGSQYGLVVMAANVVLVRVLYLQYRIFQVGQLLHFSVKQFYANIGSVLISTGIAWVITHFLVGNFDLPNWLAITSIGLIFSALYALIFWKIGATDWLDIRTFFQRIQAPGFRK